MRRFEPPKGAEFKTFRLDKSVKEEAIGTHLSLVYRQ
jgi:hypothetical protein